MYIAFKTYVQSSSSVHSPLSRRDMLAIWFVPLQSVAPMLLLFTSRCHIRLLMFVYCYKVIHQPLQSPAIPQFPHLSSANRCDLYHIYDAPSHNDICLRYSIGICLNHPGHLISQKSLSILPSTYTVKAANKLPSTLLHQE